MATATFMPTAAGTNLFGTSANDTITLDMSGAAAGNYTVNTRAGSDTVIFDGILATAGAAAGIYNFAAGAFGDSNANVTPIAYETLTFSNGTITSAASVTPEQLLAAAISGEIGDLGDDVSSPTDGASTVDATDDFNLSTVLDWNGTAVTPNAGAWTIQSINGVASSNNANISIVDGGVIQGRVSVNGTNNGINVTAENAYHTAITEIGGKQEMSIDVVLSDGAGNTFSETLSVDVLGVASGADNTFVGTAAGETVDGLGGNDTMSGGDGVDVLFGNDGDDQIFAGAGDTGADTFVGGAGDDILGGGAGDDVLVGNGHIGAGVATTFGLIANDGSNTIFGGEGDDAIAVGGYDQTTGAVGDFQLTSAGGTHTSANFNGTMGGTAWAGAGDDEIWGSATGDDTIGGGDGIDSINTLDGDNIVYGGEGDDIINGGAGDSTIYGGAGVDAITGGAGDELIFNGAGDDVAVIGGGGNDTLFGGAGDDNLTGGAGDDVFAFVEGNGNDVIADFTDGDDLIDFSGLAGVSSINDLVIADDGADLILYYGTNDTLTLSGETGNLGTTITDADFIFA